MSAAVELEFGRAIIAALRHRDGQATFEDLVNDIREHDPNAAEIDVKAALWPLISRAVVELTADNRLRLTT